MTIRAVVFDIGGVLEITPDLGVTSWWETRLGLSPGELDERMHDAWIGGSIGTITLDDVHQAITDRLGLDAQDRADFMADIWREYLGNAITVSPASYRGPPPPRDRSARTADRYRRPWLLTPRPGQDR